MATDSIRPKPKRPHSSLPISCLFPPTLPSTHLLFAVCFLILLVSPLSTASPTTAKPSIGSLAASSATNTLSAALSSAASSATSTGAASSASKPSAQAIGTATKLLYSMMGAPKPSSTNPYPIRTMIGNMVFRLRQHKTPLMIVPPVLRLLYSYREPIISTLSTAWKGIGANPAAVAGAAGLAAKGASDLASASSNLSPLAAAGAGAFGAANPGFMFPGPMALPGPFPGGLMSPLAAPAFAPPLFAKK